MEIEVHGEARKVCDHCRGRAILNAKKGTSIRGIEESLYSAFLITCYIHGEPIDLCPEHFVLRLNIELNIELGDITGWFEDD